MKWLISDQATGQDHDILLLYRHQADQVDSDAQQLIEKLNLPSSSLDRWAKGKSSAGHFSPNQVGQLVGWLHYASGSSTSETINQIWKCLVQNKALISKKLSLDLSMVPSEDLDQIAFSASHAIVLAQVQIGQFKSTSDAAFELNEIQIICDPAHAGRVQEAIERGNLAGETRQEIMAMMNAPGNKLRPEDMAQWALSSGQKYGYDVRVYEQEAIESMGLGALIAVNRGSEWPARFIVAEYHGSEDGPTIGFVGKGVTFDTGGLSIKGHQNMHFMKSDMGGAAAVLGATEYIARLGLPVNLVTIVPTTDNCVDATAVKPGDIITGYSGKTIEIIDTDAEGRLILSDALAYMVKHFKPEVLIDAATLTGSAVRALGYEAGALFSKNDDLANQLIQAGQASGEKLWRMPMFDAYLDDIKSDVADIKNLGPKPLAGASVAAKFLEFFTSEHPAWAHLDIAGVAFGNTPLSGQKNGTGYGILLLEQFVRNYIKK